MPFVLRSSPRLLIARSAKLGHRYESIAAAAWKKSVANKTGLSKQLDSTMHDGSHDMKAFGLGFLRSLASKQEQAVFNVFLWNVYTTMEESFDAVRKRSDNDGAAMKQLWERFGEDLRRKEALREDLEMFGINSEDPAATAPSAATLAYLQQIKRAAETGGDLLIGHFYTRYFADLFGGSMQGLPTRLALGLPKDLQFYTFPPSVEADKRAYIESIYAKINEVSEGFERQKKTSIVQEARTAFKHNADVYTERALLLPAAGGWGGAVRGRAYVRGSDTTGGDAGVGTETRSAQAGSWTDPCNVMSWSGSETHKCSAGVCSRLGCNFDRDLCSVPSKCTSRTNHGLVECPLPDVMFSSHRNRRSRSAARPCHIVSLSEDPFGQEVEVEHSNDEEEDAEEAAEAPDQLTL
eukprot:CAMPEP_0196730642 /NCGR_PEP_ID=MMETSP1091-20130531/10648_1 /TAXON_ID=302021 /ORGANISM="Rhodomonas sp., Strain CCMP768" /LENGTH=407 /DNA_ID=CAMNT_0042073687 /DNA_START=13 /DNA_END=1235 /DNA_ORIENTATION=-